MTEQSSAAGARRLARVSTGIRGFDAITGGGLPERRTCLVTGTPGSGKTTFGNQLAFAHAAAGGQVIVASLLTETHSVLLENLQSFDFFDSSLVGARIHYLSVLTPLMEGGLDATVDLLRQEIQKVNATLLVIDGTVIDDMFTLPGFDLRRFAHRLDTQSSFLGCTTVLLTATTDSRVNSVWAQVNGVVLLTNRPVGSQSVRGLEVIKMRGAHTIGGVHQVSITEAGLTVFPRLEALAGTSRAPLKADHGLGTGISGLDAMLGGGLMPGSSTLVMGTPGSGKTILGLHYLVEGADRGEPGLMVSFHETVDDLATTAERVGLDLRRHIESGLIQVVWNAPLEMLADAWAWQVLDTVARHRPSRVFIDALTDVYRVMTDIDRMPLFVTALVNELRNRGTTVLISAEIDEYTDDSLAVPIPAASAAMDNGILLRHVELRAKWQRVIAVPKVRQAAADPSIRDLIISDSGMSIASPVPASSGVLTGRATLAGGDDEGDSS